MGQSLGMGEGLSFGGSPCDESPADRDEELDTLRRQVACLQQSLLGLESTIAGLGSAIARLQTPPPVRDEVANQAQKDLEKARDHSLDIQKNFTEPEQELARGERLYFVQLTGEQRMKRVVGVPSVANKGEKARLQMEMAGAEAKFKAHFGMTGFTEPHKKVLVEPYDESKHRDQLPKNVLDAISESRHAA